MAEIFPKCRNTPNNPNFHYRTYLVKINDQSFFSLSLAHCPSFGGKKGSVTHNFIRVSSAMPKFKKSNDPIPGTCLDWQDGRTVQLMKGQTDPFYRTLPISAGDPKSATAVNWHLKVKHRDYVGLTKCYCIKVSMQKISSIHKFITKMQQIFGFHEMATPINHIHPKIIEITFRFPEYVPVCKKICSFYQSILEIQSNLESRDHTILTATTQNIFTFSLCDFVSICKK